MTRYARRRRREADAPETPAAGVLPAGIAQGPCVDVWAPDIPDRVTAWWVARRRWNDAVEHHAADVGVEPWQVRNECATRRPFWRDGDPHGGACP